MHAADVDPRIPAAAAGDRAAMQSLLTELLPRGRNLIRYLVRGDSEVDDIAQEALLALARGFAGYRGEGSLTAWADRVVARVTFAWLRKRRRAEATRKDGVDLAAVPSPDSPPDRYTTRRELAELLDRLPEDQRHVLVLHHVMGMSVPEVAAELDVPVETIRSRLRLGIGKLRTMYDDSPRSDRSGQKLTVQGGSVCP